MESFISHLSYDHSFHIVCYLTHVLFFSLFKFPNFTFNITLPSFHLFTYHTYPFQCQFSFDYYGYFVPSNFLLLLKSCMHHRISTVYRRLPVFLFLLILWQMFQVTYTVTHDQKKSNYRTINFRYAIFSSV